MTTTIKRALISVSDKSNMLTFAKKLHQNNVEILSTGGTAGILSNANIPVIKVSDYTGFPEIMKGRIKTLHHKIYGGLLGRGQLDNSVMSEYSIDAIDLVVVNLYPFQEKVSSVDITLEEAIENIDIGGPTMLRAAAKNYQHTTVICDPHDYANIIEKITNNNGQIDCETRFKLACKVFSYTAAYEDNISNYLNSLSLHNQKLVNNFPRTINFQLHESKKICYGENPHQKASIYIDKSNNEIGIPKMQQLQGRDLSYNNIVDTDTALRCVNTFNRPSCVIVKHANPCSVASGNTIEQAYNDAYKADSISAFGGVISCNNIINELTATAIVQKFVEVVIAPKFTEEAITVFKRKPRIRILISGDNRIHEKVSLDFKRIYGGMLIQTQDHSVKLSNELKKITKRKPSDQELSDLFFAWKVVKHVKSNAIVYAKNNKTIGIGAGQMSRIFSAKIAIKKAVEAKSNIAGAVMASDAFLPFTDVIDFAYKKGITAIIQPGGAIRDQEVINAANQYNIAMIFTGTRHFKH